MLFALANSEIISIKMNNLRISIFSLFFSVFLSLFSLKTYAQNKINWLTLEQAYAKTKIAPKKVIIDVYTGWCGWCKVMDKNTFTNASVIKYINENYYAVKLDAESTKDIRIENKVYKFDETNKTNQAAIELLQGKMSYPSIVYLDEKFNMIQPLPGYMDAKAFHQVITYIGDNNHKKEDFEKYKVGTYLSKYKSLPL
jgi:thioredoxin-related protein